MRGWGWDVGVQVRWSAVLARVLRQYRYTLKLSIAWRPLYELLVHSHLRSATGYEGAALVAVHAATVCRMVSSAARISVQVEGRRRTLACTM